MADWLQFDPSNLPWLRREGEAAREATSAFQFGANLALQRRKLALEEQQSVLEYRKAQAQISNLALRNKLESQLLDDSLADKETMAEAIPKRNALPLEQRLEMPVPPFKTTAAFNQWNTLADNDRMAYERSVAGQINATKAKILGAVPELAQDYFDTTDPDERRTILQRAREQYVKQQPASIAAESRIAMMEQRLAQMLAVEGVKAENRKELEALRTDLQMLRDQNKPLSSGSDRFDLPYTKQLEYQARLESIQNDLRYLKDPKGRDDAIKALTKEYEEFRIDRRHGRRDATNLITTKEEYDALPSGSEFTGSDGKLYRKP